MISRLAYIVPLAALLACSPPQPPVEEPDGGDTTVQCDPACDPQLEACNTATGVCELLSTAPQQSLVAARAAAHGDADHPVVGALVTYVVTGEPENTGVNGFFLQAEKEGPALFVAVNPASLNPQPQPGDRVSLRVTNFYALGGQHEARIITGYQRLSTGNDLRPLVQDVSRAGNLVSAAGDYDGELVDIAGRIRHDWLPFTGATVHWKSELELLNGMGDPNLILRTVDAVTKPMGLGTNCNVALQNVPLRRVAAQVQIFAFSNDDFTQRSCPPTRLTDALAISPTHVRLTFERPIDPASILADGSQFTFGSGLSGNHAVVKDEYQIIVTTGVQTPRQAHSVSIANTARDVVGGQLAVPSQKANFQGYFTRAKLMLNEISCARANDRDLIELIAMSDGSTLGMRLTYDGPTSGTIGTFPDTTVQTGDIIVVHLNASPTSGDAVYSETMNKAEQTAASNYPDAWDFVYDKFSCQHSNVVLRVVGPDGVTVDGVALARTDLNSNQRPSSFGSVWLKALQLDEHWVPKTCNGLTCSYSSQPSAIDVAADWTQARTNMQGVTRTIQRQNLTDTDAREDWVTAAPTWGAKNAGQQ